MKINGHYQYLWRVGDQEGRVIDILTPVLQRAVVSPRRMLSPYVEARRNAKAMKPAWSANHAAADSRHRKPELASKGAADKYRAAWTVHHQAIATEKNHRARPE